MSLFRGLNHVSRECRNIELVTSFYRRVLGEPRVALMLGLAV
jgi:catechol 2,3-dioxygenase-like lactoylglutathione lyase family enzyme